MILHASLMMALASPTMPDSLVHPLELGEAQVATFRNIAVRSSAPVQRVSAADITLRGAVSLTEVVNTLAGASVKDYGGIGGMKTVSIRSFGAQHTGISYDGMPVTDAQNGQVDIGCFNLDNVQTLRLDVAGSDDIFRSARLAASVGVLTIETRRPDLAAVRRRATAQLRAGSFGTVNPYLQLQQRLGQRWSLDVWGNYQHSEGNYPFTLRNGQLTTHERRLNSQVSSLTAEANVFGQLRRAGDLQLKLSAYDSSRGLPGSVVLYTQHPTEHLWDRTLTVSALHRIERGPWHFKTNLRYAHLYNRYTDRAPALPAPTDDRYRQQQASLSAVALWQPPGGGGSARSPWSLSLAEDFDIAHLNSDLPSAVQPTRESSYTALSGKYDDGRWTVVTTVLGLVATEQARVTAGQTQKQLGSTAEGGAISSSSSAAPMRWRVSPSASLAFRVLPGYDWHLRAAFKDSYRLPTFNDLYYLRVGNRNLRPERALQSNFGTTFGWHFQRHRQHTLTFTADAYYNRVRDKIVAIPTMFVWHMRNVGRVAMTGADLAANYSALFSPRFELSLSANYSWQHAVDVTDRAAKNYRDQIAYTPRHTANVVAALRMPWCNVSYTLHGVGERYALAQNTAAYRIAPYCDYGVSINRTFDFIHLRRCAGELQQGGNAFRLHVSAEALNLGGRNYEVVKYYPMPGRQFRLAAKIVW